MFKNKQTQPSWQTSSSDVFAAVSQFSGQSDSHKKCNFVHWTYSSEVHTVGVHMKVKNSV